MQTTKQSKIMPEIYITTFDDKSGGFFSLKDLKPEPLAWLVKDSDTRVMLDCEYNKQLNQSE